MHTWWFPESNAEPYGSDSFDVGNAFLDPPVETELEDQSP